MKKYTAVLLDPKGEKKLCDGDVVSEVEKEARKIRRTKYGGGPIVIYHGKRFHKSL